MTKLNKIQKKDMLEELKKQEKLMEMDVLHFKDNDQRRQDGFQKTILAIQNIVNRKLYKACAPSLEIYFRDVWKISRAQVYRFLDCATVLNTLEGFTVRPSKERLCRSLKRHGKSPTNIRNLWTLVKLRASDREITSTLIGKCWEEIVNNGKEVIEDPIPKKKECKPRKPKIDLNNPSTIVIPSSDPRPKNKMLKNHPQVSTAFISNMKPSFSSPSVVSVTNPMNHPNSSISTPLMNSTIYANSTTASSLNTPTTQDNTLTDNYYPSNTNNQEMMLQSLPTPTMSTSKTLYNADGQPANDMININSSDVNVGTPTAVNNQTLYTLNSNSNEQNEKKIISSYPSPTASHIISQQQQQQPQPQQQPQQQPEFGQIQQYPPTSQFVVKQDGSTIPVQKMNYQVGSVIVNPSPNSTPIVDSAILDSLPHPTQQVLLNDPNSNVVLPSNGYQQTIQSNDPSNNNIQIINQPYNPHQQIMTSQGCILSPTIQQTQQLPSQGVIQNNYNPMATYQISQPQTPQSVLMNNPPNMMDSNGMLYHQPTPQKNVLYQTLPSQLPMHPASVVYTVPPTPAHNVILSPPSQSPVNYYPEYQNSANY